MKRIMMFFVALFLVPSLCFAEPTVLVLLTGSLNLYKHSDKSAYTVTTDNFQKGFTKYKLLIGDEYKKQIEATGNYDIGSMERADILAACKSYNPDYIIVYNFLPYHNVLFGSSTAEVHLRILDKEKTLINKKYSYKSAWASMNGRYNKIYSDIEKDVFAKIFP